MFENIICGKQKKNKKLLNDVDNDFSQRLNILLQLKEKEKENDEQTSNKEKSLKFQLEK